MRTRANKTPVIQASEQVRMTFLVKVYQHLALAIVAFIGFEYFLFAVGYAEKIYDFVLRSGGIGWLVILGVFMLGTTITTKSAHAIDKFALQYGSLFAQSALFSIVFAVPLYSLFVIEDDAPAVWVSVLITGVGFAVLSVIAFTTRKDLSVLRPLLFWGGVVAIGLIVVSTLFSFHLGPIFSVAMIGLMGASILYQTQKIVRAYPEWAYVGAAVGLFGSLMVMLWYVINLFTER